MKRVGLTMRVDRYSSLNQRTDAIDQRWFCFLKKCDLFPVLLPNNDYYTRYIIDLGLDGVIFTGGNSLVKLGGDALERDSFEHSLLEYMIKIEKPVFGVCRGMQVIQNYFGVRLEKISNHASRRHSIEFNNSKMEVNSYHNYGTKYSIDCLKVLSCAQDGVIEVIAHKNLPIMGIMWHPEREEVFSDFDINLFKKHFLS